MQQWVRTSSARALITAGELDDFAGGTTLPLVYVDRAATHVAGPLEFDTYQGGSDLRVAPPRRRQRRHHRGRRLDLAPHKCGVSIRERRCPGPGHPP
jgi:hypothetical protein